MQVDEEGNSLDFESLLSQLLEVIITIVSNKRFCSLLEPVVPQLVYVTIGALKQFETLSSMLKWFALRTTVFFCMQQQMHIGTGIISRCRRSLCIMFGYTLAQV